MTSEIRHTPAPPAVLPCCAACRRTCSDRRLQALDDPALSDARVVHDFRKAMKRWRAMLRLLEPFLGDGGSALHDEARDLARTLAGARDVRAALDALADLPEDPALSARSRKTIRARLEHLGLSAETELDRAGDARAAAQRASLCGPSGATMAARGHRLRRPRRPARPVLSAHPRRHSRTTGWPPTSTSCTNCASASSPTAIRWNWWCRCGPSSADCGSTRRSGCAIGSATSRTSTCWRE